MKAGILTIGDELLIGQVVNTNSAWLGIRLNEIGFEVYSQTTIGDGLNNIVSALKQLSVHCDLIIITGGLGPTHDDITKHALAHFVGVELFMDDSVLESVAQKLQHRGREVTEGSKQIGLVPQGAEVLSNAKGTAPGLWMGRETIGQKGKTSLIAVPGVPYEMKIIFRDHIATRLREIDGLQVIAQKTLLSSGTGESMLAKKLGDVSSFLDKGLRLAWLPNASTGVRMRITAKGDEQKETEERLAEFEKHIREQLNYYIYGEEGDNLEEVFGESLKSAGKTVAVAESCTGGLLGDRLTKYPGSSRFFKGGVISYSNESKMDLLGVKSETIKEHGAVSEQVAMELAESVRQKFDTDIGLSTTGIAGPGGGTEEKPVGTIFTALATEDGVKVKKLTLTTDRDMNRTLTTTYLLFWALKEVRGEK